MANFKVKTLNKNFFMINDDLEDVIKSTNEVWQCDGSLYNYETSFNHNLERCIQPCFTSQENLTRDLNINNMSFCYAIVFNNILYSYIGSSLNLFSRAKSHNSNIKKILKNVCSSFDHNSHGLETNSILEKFISSEISNNNATLSYSIHPIYLTYNYLKDFRDLYPNYKLSRGRIYTVILY